MLRQFGDIRRDPSRLIARERLGRCSPARFISRAAAVLNELTDSSSERVRLEAAKFSLGCAGIKPAVDANVSVNLELRAGYVIDLSGRDPGAERVKITDSEAGAVIDREAAGVKRSGLLQR